MRCLSSGYSKMPRLPSAFLSWLVVLCLSAFWVGCARTPRQPALTPTAERPTRLPAPITEIRPELARHFEGAPGAFVLYDLNGNRYIRYNPERCAERFIPASTFKVLNSLIGLESGVIPDETHVIKWDGTRYDVSSWNQDHTMQTAIQNSVVWYYQELARRVGKEKMQKYVEAAGYGNRDISGQIDTFWLEGGLRISADEQVEFLTRLYKQDVPFSPRAVTIVKNILVLDKTDTYRLSGKTGSGVRVAPQVNWFVGYVEKNGNVYVFAVNVEPTATDAKLAAAIAKMNQAKEIAVQILREMGLLS